MKINLSKNQQKIVDHANGAILVKAGPGSGKTRVLIERIKKLLLTQKRCKILALTFSNLAADEMKKRLEEDINIVDYVDNVTVETIHSFCLNLVQTRGNLIGLQPDLVLFENASDHMSILKEVIGSNSKWERLFQKDNKPEKLLQKFLSLISEQKKKFIDPEVCIIHSPFPEIYSAYNQRMRQQNAMDFDDILFYAYRILTENPSVVKLYNTLYKYICVDEAQDLNFAQYNVIKALCGPNYHNIMLVGDVNQSIYGFNGSDSSLMSKKFIKDFEPTVYELKENYRSAKAIVRFANKLEHYDSTTDYVYEGELKAQAFPNEAKEAAFVVSRIQELIKQGHSEIEGKLEYNDIAIIGRNKYVFTEVEKLLAAKQIPYSYKKNSSDIENESELMKAFSLIMRIMINCQDYLHVQQLCKMVAKSYSDLSLNLDKACDGINIVKNIIVGSKYELLCTALPFLKSDNFDFNKAIKQIENALPTSMDANSKYLVLNDIYQWKAHWTKYTSQVPKENRSLLSFRNYISLGKTQNVANNTGIALLSAHMSKGLQFEVVFIIGLSEGTFPDYRAVRSGGYAMEQEKNNMYVAVTRAKRLCYLSYPINKMMPWHETKRQKPSRFIKDIIS